DDHAQADEHIGENDSGAALDGHAARRTFASMPLYGQSSGSRRRFNALRWFNGQVWLDSPALFICPSCCCVARSLPRLLRAQRRLRAGGYQEPTLRNRAHKEHKVISKPPLELLFVPCRCFNNGAPKMSATKFHVGDRDHQFGDVPIGLGKMLLFLSTKMLAVSQVELG